MFAQILTKDSVTVFVNAIMYYKVANATHAVANVDDYSGSARLLAATTLRNVLGTRNLGDILSEREAIAQVSGAHGTKPEYLNNDNNQPCRKCNLVWTRPRTPGEYWWRE